MKGFITITVVVGLWVGSAVGAEISASLDVGDVQDVRALPYRSADLTIFNGSNQILRTVSLRWRQGGPTILQPVTIAPQARQTVTVQLPVISQQQTYDLRMLQRDDVDAPPVGVARAAINWPVEFVTPGAFFARDAYEEWGDFPTNWNHPLLQKVCLAAVIAYLALGAVLFLKSSVFRLLGLITVSGIAVFAMGLLLLPQQIVIQKTIPEESLIFVGCRRSTTWVYGNGELVPLYQDLHQFRRETMVIHPTQGIRVGLRPEEVRVFRLKRKAAASSGD